MTTSQTRIVWPRKEPSFVINHRQKALTDKATNKLFFFRRKKMNNKIVNALKAAIVSGLFTHAASHAETKPAETSNPTPDPISSTFNP
jgi:hypothetical protein